MGVRLGKLGWRTSLALFLSIHLVSQTLWPQEHSYSETVKDQKGESLIGVNVLVKGTSMGTATNFDGNFTVQASQNDVLVFFYVRFATQELPLSTVTGHEWIEITLIEDQELLDEVVIIGYGESSKRNPTTSVAQLDPLDVSVRNVSTPTQMLQGQLPGVNVMMSNGLPGSRSNVNISGVSSINGDNQPLIVIDGIQISKASATYNSQGEYQQDPLSMINPADIKSIDVLKDAAASAIYGSRASSEVIIIETKQGENSRPKVSFSQLAGMQLLPQKLNLTTSDEYLTIQREAVNNQNSILALTPGSSGYIDINKVLGNVPVDYYDVNWKDLILNKNAFSSQTDISFSGGNRYVSAFASVGYFNQEGLLKQTGLKRFSARANLDFKLSEAIDVGTRLNANKT